MPKRTPQRRDMDGSRELAKPPYAPERSSQSANRVSQNQDMDGNRALVKPPYAAAGNQAMSSQATSSNESPHRTLPQVSLRPPPSLAQEAQEIQRILVNCA